MSEATNAPFVTEDRRRERKGLLLLKYAEPGREVHDFDQLDGFVGLGSTRRQTQHEPHRQHHHRPTRTRHASISWTSRPSRVQRRFASRTSTVKKTSINTMKITVNSALSFSPIARA